MSKKAIGIYLRVSTERQDTKSQEPDLRAWIRTHAAGRRVMWFKDKLPGSNPRRPGVRNLEAAIDAGKIGTVVVWRIDRLGRTARELLALLEDLDARGVEFVSLREGVDASTAAGRMFRHMLIGFAQYERELISERIRAGIKRARADGREWHGRREGTRTRLTPKVVHSIQTLRRAGTPKAEIARQLGIDRSTVYEAIRIGPRASRTLQLSS